MSLNQNRTNEQSAANHWASRWSIRLMLLTTVNLPLLALAGLFLIYDYQREIVDRVKKKRISLEEEAKTLLPAAVALQHRPDAALQQYIDAVCAQMQMPDSPGHHIAVRLTDVTLQSKPHNRASPEMLSAMQLAAESPSHRAAWNGGDLIVGVAQREGVTVFVAETLKNVRQAVRAGVLRRLTAFLIMFLIAASIVNLVLLRFVTNPVQNLVATVQRIATGQLGTQSEPLHSAEFDYLATEINRMSLSLASADRNRRTQMVKAREIQNHLLPQSTDCLGLNAAFLFQPAEDIGGDYYDVVRTADGACLLCVADVTGHGVPAAMSAAMLKMLLREASGRHSSPAEILGFVNERFLSASIVDDFVSMLVVRAHPQSRRIEYASAGHEPGWLLFPDGTLQEVPSTGLLLGVNSGAEWDTETVGIADGSRLFMVSDGAAESFNNRGECFGRHRLAKLCAESRRQSIHDALTRINETLTAFRNGASQGDDITIVLVEFNLTV
jgi:sigma-B regulation protein RsbU (phosphoserine phosphatase)